MILLHKGRIPFMTYDTGRKKVNVKTGDPYVRNIIKQTTLPLLLLSLLSVSISAYATDHAYVSYKCISPDASASSVSPLIQITNDGTTNIRYADIKVRYWYTIDTNSSQTFNADFAPFGTENVTGAFFTLAAPVTNADSYLEVSFSPGAGILGPGDSSGELQFRFNKNDWSNYSQTNDFSFDASMTSYTASTKISLYVRGALVWGADLVTGETAPAYSENIPGPITVDIDVNSGRTAISPYVYGGNQMWSTFNTETETCWTARRFGGNRATTYNWENNASNAGKEDLHKSDDFWCTALGVSSGERNVPGIVVTKFHDKSLANGWYSLLTLQMAGYVSRDMNGPVQATEAAPSARWDSVSFVKGSAFAYPPSLTDSTVYIDELLDYLVKKYGTASAGSGIKGYALDNETELWNETHPYVHPNKVTCDELVRKSVELAKVIKNADASADVFAPVSYGFNGYYSLQDASDWISTYDASYDWFVDYYLTQLKSASDAAGKRLLDVFDIHWYPEAKGGGARITFDAFDAANTYCSKARIQAPRTLWDSSFTENSWISQWHPGFLPIIPRLLGSVNAYYPGTRLAVTEYNFGGDCHISGGIAQTDALGIFGKYGVYFATYWAVHSPQDYATASFKLYLNYDGTGSKYGSTNVGAAATDIENCSVYASIEGSDDTRLHVIAINKNYDNQIDYTFRITGSRSYSSARVWGFDSSGSTITERTAVSSISSNTFTYAIPKLTVLHFVLTAGSGPVETPLPTALPTSVPTAVPTSTPGTETPAPTATPAGATLGDVNHDGSITIVDALLIAQYYVGLNPSSFDISASDTNKDGIVNIVDALLIAQYYVGLISGF